MLREDTSLPPPPLISSPLCKRFSTLLFLHQRCGPAELLGGGAAGWHSRLSSPERSAGAVSIKRQMICTIALDQGAVGLSQMTQGSSPGRGKAPLQNNNKGLS